MRALIVWAKGAARLQKVRRRFPKSVIHGGAELDDESSLGPYAVLFPKTQLVASSFGAYAYMQSGSAAYNAIIGPYCSIAGRVVIGLAAHPTSMISSSPVFYDPTQPLPRFFAQESSFVGVLPRTVVGADVWIGQSVMIKAGVRIGVGAVIGAGSVVTRDIEPYQIAAGNPCRIIRPRFSADIAAALLESRWWECDAEMLVPLAGLFTDPRAFVAAVHAKALP